MPTANVQHVRPHLLCPTQAAQFIFSLEDNKVVDATAVTILKK